MHIKNNNTLIGNAEDRDIVKLMYNLSEYDHYSMTSGSLWHYYRDEFDGVDENVSEFKPFNYKTKIIKTPA